LLKGISGNENSFGDFSKKNKRENLVVVFKSGLETSKKDFNRMEDLVDKPKKKKSNKNKLKKDETVLGKREKEEIEIIADKDELKGQFAPDWQDERFRGLYEDKKLAIDPTHVEYKKEKLQAVFNEKMKRKKS